MMMPPTTAFSAGDVVLVPFPFTDRAAAKRRPALVCSAGAFNHEARHLVLAMITTQAHVAWPHDVAIDDLDAAGLSAPSIVRWKLFTLADSFIVRRIGALSARDRSDCRAALPIAL